MNLSFLTKSFIGRLVFPLLILSVLGYSQWAYSYLFAYKRIYIDRNDRASMLAFLIVVNVLQSICYISWIILIIQGPGKVPFKIPPYNLAKYIAHGRKHCSDETETLSKISTFSSEDGEFIKPPPIFDCDRNGLPYWCSECSTLKVYRMHHSSINSRCIPMFDHYCSFVGVTISSNNYLIFWIYVWSMELMLLFTTISMIVYGAKWGRLHTSLIVLVVITGTFSVLVGHLIICLMLDIYSGETTIERLTRRRWNSYEKKVPVENREYDYSTFVNVQHPTDDNLRLIVALTPTDKSHKNGIWNTLKVWFNDTRKLNTAQTYSDFTYSMYGKDFIANVHKRIDEGNFRIFSSDEY